ncbi:MAG: hypothetical protein NTZ49_02770 [Candidatus Parcubacteria bacterium]|nr:hypothetical protein [Candidatus Parcubacteria bacterium]
MTKCKKCGAPLEGFLYNTIGKLMGIKPSAKDPELCNKCEEESGVIKPVEPTVSVEKEEIIPKEPAVSAEKSEEVREEKTEEKDEDNFSI